MSYYLGVDIGTSSAKAVAYTDEGVVLGRVSVTYPMQHPAPDRSEQDADEIVRAVRKCICDVVEAQAPAKPRMLAFSAAMHSILAVDGEGRPLTACMIWADNRAAAIAEELRATEQGMEFYRRTGVPVHAMTPLCKLLWLREHEPGVFGAAARFIGIKEYVFWNFFNEYLVDTGCASATGLLNMRSLEWDHAILQYVRVDCSKLARVVPPGHVMYYDVVDGGASAPQPRPGAVSLRAPLPLDAGTPVVIGGSDGALANLATNAGGEHVLAITIGTSGAVRKMIPSVEVDEEMRTFCYHVEGPDYICGGATNNGAVVIQWLKEMLLETGESYDELLAQAASVAPGSEDLLFIPYILGERAPIWDSKARGIYFGLDIRHRKAHLVRAAMEGVLYGLYSIGKILGIGAGIGELHATGGFARSPLWLQMLADVFGERVLAFDEEDSSALGAVVLGMKALGLRGCIQRQAVAVYEPDAAVHALYRERFGKFERIYGLVKGEFK